MVEQPGSVVGRGDDPAGSKNASSERPKPENRPKTATNGPKTPIFGPEEAKTTKCAKNTKNSNDFATEFTKPEAWTAERG